MQAISPGRSTLKGKIRCLSYAPDSFRRPRVRQDGRPAGLPPMLSCQQTEESAPTHMLVRLERYPEETSKCTSTTIRTRLRLRPELRVPWLVLRYVHPTRILLYITPARVTSGVHAFSLNYCRSIPPTFDDPYTFSALALFRRISTFHATCLRGTHGCGRLSEVECSFRMYVGEMRVHT